MTKQKLEEKRIIKAWAIIDAETGEFCHYLGDDEVTFFRHKKDALKFLRHPDAQPEYYKVIPIEIKPLIK